METLVHHTMEAIANECIVCILKHDDKIQQAELKQVIQKFFSKNKEIIRKKVYQIYLRCQSYC